MKKKITVNDSIRLDQFLKWAKITDTGGMAKNIILDEKVKVNDRIETRRGKKLFNGDIVTVGDDIYEVVLKNEEQYY